MFVGAIYIAKDIGQIFSIPNIYRNKLGHTMRQLPLPFLLKTGSRQLLMLLTIAPSSNNMLYTLAFGIVQLGLGKRHCSPLSSHSNFNFGSNIFKRIRSMFIIIP